MRFTRTLAREKTAGMLDALDAAPLPVKAAAIGGVAFLAGVLLACGMTVMALALFLGGRQ